jgi:hypothetical protein
VAYVDTAKSDAISSAAATTATVQAQLNTGGATALAIIAAKTDAIAAAAITTALVQTHLDTAVTAAGTTASTLTSVQARLDTGDFAAVMTESAATVTRAGILEAKNTLKLDVHGYVSGTESVNDGVTSSMVVLADKFLIAKPDASGTPIPVMSLGTVAGVSALGLNGNIIVDGSIVARSIDTRGLSIKDGAGTVLFASGTPLSSGNITPASGWLNTNVTYAGLADAKPPTNADHTASNTAAAIAGQGAFATLGQINLGNIGTYIASGAIDTAFIRDAAISTAKIGLLQVDTAQIGPNAVTFPSFASGASLTVTTATYPVGTKLYVIATCDFSFPNGQSHYLYLKVDGATQSTRRGYNALANASFSSGMPAAISCSFVMSSSSHTITITSTATAATPEILVMGFKK